MRPDLAALLGSRICHDLISPLGAIGNGVELLGLSGVATGPELTLIGESVADATARIRFFRIAFGTGGADQQVTRSGISEVLADYFRSGRIRPVWSAAGDTPRGEARAALLAVLCAETALGAGGTITAARAGAGWTVTGEGPRLRTGTPLWQGFAASHADPAAVWLADLAPAHVQFALLPEAVAALGRGLRVTMAPDNVTLAF